MAHYFKIEEFDRAEIGDLKIIPYLNTRDERLRECSRPNPDHKFFYKELFSIPRAHHIGSLMDDIFDIHTLATEEDDLECDHHVVNRAQVLALIQHIQKAEVDRGWCTSQCANSVAICCQLEKLADTFDFSGDKVLTVSWAY